MWESSGGPRAVGFLSAEGWGFQSCVRPHGNGKFWISEEANNSPKVTH